MDALYTAVATANGREGRTVSSDGQVDLALAIAAGRGGNRPGPQPPPHVPPRAPASIATALGPVARQARADVSEVSVTAEVSIGKDETGFGLSVVLRVELPDSLEGETGQLLVKQAHEVCPYSKATRGNIPVELVVE
ncbi:Ohr family peroxiredoxin [Kitasatospora indigofera]|uniref:Ohr family peroxiredoxin n=1 Tax=Kitasatospora indigofera TaxID=67307 RepID=UPI0036607B45